jgi:hypothetical protein
MNDIYHYKVHIEGARRIFLQTESLNRIYNWHFSGTGDITDKDRIKLLKYNYSLVIL